LNTAALGANYIYHRRKELTAGTVAARLPGRKYKMPSLPTPPQTGRKRRRANSAPTTPNPRTPKRSLERVFRKAAREANRAARQVRVKAVRRTVRTTTGATGGVSKWGTGSNKKNMPGYKLAKTGAAYNFEYSGTGTCDEMGVIGHATYILYKARLMGWTIVLKKLFEKVGNPSQQFQETFDMTDGDEITVTYKLAAIGSIQTETYVNPGAPTSIHALAQYFSDLARGYNAENTFSDQTEFFHLKFTPKQVTGTLLDYGPAMIRLDYTTIQCYVDATLKVQNRTVAAVGDDEVDVNNVPLDGKVYYGDGTGAQWKKNNTAITFYCDSESGLIRQDPGSTLYAPPLPAEFDKTLKKFGSVSIAPGDIKVSHLTDYMTASFDNWMAGVKCTGNGVTYFVKKHYGKYRFFVLERMIDVSQETPTPIILVYEHNVKFIVNAKTSVHNPSIQLGFQTQTGQDF